MKRILIMTIQAAAVWVVLALLLYTWSKNHTTGLTLSAFNAVLRLPKVSAISGVI